MAAFGASCRFRLYLSCLGLLLVPHLLCVILGHLAVGVVPLLADQTLADLLGAVGALPVVSSTALGCCGPLPFPLLLCVF